MNVRLSLKRRLETIKNLSKMDFGIKFVLK
jgi:hypothetical protein